MSDQVVEIYRAPNSGCSGDTGIYVDIVDRTVELRTQIPGMGGWFTRFAAPVPDDLPAEQLDLLAKGEMPTMGRYFELTGRDINSETHDNEMPEIIEKPVSREVMHLPKAEAEAILHYFFRAPALHQATSDALKRSALESHLLYDVKDGFQDRYKLPNEHCSIFGFATRPGWLLERFRNQYE